MLKEFAKRSTWVFDVDDCLYTIDCGLHDQIKKRICHHANDNDDIRGWTMNWLGEDRNIEPEDLGTVFPKIVSAFIKERPEQLEQYLDEVYGDDYSFIKPNSKLVRSFEEAQNRGVRIVFYTNGPSSPEPTKNYHTQKVLQRLGFSQEFNNHARQNTYDLIKSVKAGHGKPTEQGMKNFLTDLSIDPANALYFDDSPKNLRTGTNLGMRAIWTWTSKKRPKKADEDLAKDIGALKTRNTGKAVHNLARHLL